MTQLLDLSVNAIRAEDRHRKDLGDLTDLMKSIDEIGLLHPVVVREDGRLIAGERRLEAFRRLGRVSIPAVMVKSLESAVDLLVAERDENTCRKEMTITEKVALGRALEAIEKPEAKERQRDGGSRGGQASGKFTEASGGTVRETVAAQLGISGPTYDRAKRVVETAERTDLSPEAHQAAQEAVEEMERTGKVTPAYAKVNVYGHTNGHGEKQTPDVEMPLTERQRNVAQANAQRIAKLVAALDGYVIGIPQINLEQAVLTTSQEDIDHWCSVLTRASREFTHLRKAITQTKGMMQ